jgi:hypothetical protein
MKIGKKSVKVFKIRNRKGFAALCGSNLTEGKTRNQAVDRMMKAVSRRPKK